MANTRALLSWSWIAAVLMATNVQAQSIPAEGPVSVTFTATQIRPVKPMPIGGGKEFLIINQAMAASNDAGNPVLNNMGGRCQLTRLADPSAKLWNSTATALTRTMKAIKSSSNATSCPARLTTAN